jgi:hypothetical protein
MRAEFPGDCYPLAGEGMPRIRPRPKSGAGPLFPIDPFLRGGERVKAFPESRILPGLLCVGASLFAADAPPAWEKGGGVPAETAFLLDRIREPWNHFLLNGEEGFVSGSEFYRNDGEADPFLWPEQPFRRFGTDAGWETDTAAAAFSATGSNAPGEGASPYAQAEAAFSPLEGLRLHASLDQNALYSQATFPARAYAAGPGNAKDWAWFGGDAPLRSQASLGAALSRRGATLGAQANRGWWWTTSPVTGRPYPWEGFNFDLLYRAGEDFVLTLVEQRWDSPSPFPFDKAHWRRSEVALGFLGASERAWTWRLDVGFEQRDLSSRGAFRGFEEKTYPFRFRYRQDWQAPDSLPFRMVSNGSFGYREGAFRAAHRTELREFSGPHRPMQYLKAYYRYAFKGAIHPTEYLSADSQAVGNLVPGEQNRGFAAGAAYREVRKHFLVGLGGDYAMEWELPLFQGSVFDTIAGLAVRQGGYRGSDSWAANASGRLFASGDLGASGAWRAEAGLRKFGGPDAGDIEFVPSPWWASAGAGYGFKNKAGKTRLDFQLAYVGPKEVRHWGPLFEIESHPENDISLSQTLFSERIKLTVAALHAFGADFREQPNGNPVRFRLAAGVDGTFD